MQLRDDEFGQDRDRATVDTAGTGLPSGPRHAGRVTGGRRRARRKMPVPAAVATVVLLTGAGSAYTLISADAPARTAATASSSTPSSDAVGPGPLGEPSADPASPTADAAEGTPTASATPSASATTAASPSRAASAEPSSGRSAKQERSAQPTRAPSGTGPVGPDPKIAGARTSTQDVQVAESLSLRLLNGERATVGRPPLALKQDLSTFARTWAEHMSKNGFGHSSDRDRAHLKTGSRTWTGENIVWWSDASMTAQEAAEKFQSMWRHSPGHYKGQVNPEFTEVGVGMYRDASGWWGVHVFSDGA
ncbi:CAP domain-containing protein [Streptomyces sp. PCS3-D2]|uniref:CAP domain-containing protein n=1 Tax=Streptomyces sp. PCS3-D2 TaxID=1460244 RepID=UPI0012FE805B|nr:CAP domain-containing protein [Streptomyces sp. PCS3-D2]WKV71475.1 CAP domain-containing protein [Streptomyces sp. PCS3-D2]